MQQRVDIVSQIVKEVKNGDTTTKAAIHKLTESATALQRHTTFPWVQEFIISTPLNAESKLLLCADNT